MKIKLPILLLFFYLFNTNIQAQNGLENITVEKYYVSNAADSIGSIGNLPVGSVTYRIYVDMLPGYKFQAVYGVPDHTLLISTNTSFFNNEDRGATTPTYTKTQARGNTVMLDSWLSVGGACTGNLAIPKSEDDVATGGATVINNAVPPILQNNDPSAGIPLTVQDGLFTATVQSVTFVGIDPPTELAVFGSTSQVGDTFITSNGSWASLNGSTGPIASTNKVLIAQMTTNGAFHFELNIQIKSPTGNVENYVASNPVGVEITIPSLIGTFGSSNIPPGVNITSPSDGSSFITGAVVGIAAAATDADGTITSVEFFVDGISISIDNSSPYSTNYTAVSGSHSLTAKATDNLGAPTTSASITISVGSNPSPSVNITSPVNASLFIAPAIVPITANATDPNGTVSLVEFFVNGILVGGDASAPYSFNWTSVIGTVVLTARATDNLGAQTISVGVVIYIADPNIPYKIISSTNKCIVSNFCLPVTAIDTVDNVIGYDMVLHYNKTKTRPTGVITVSNALINSSYVDIVSSIDSVNGLLNISLYFNSSAPANTKFSGVGNIFCVEFTKTASFNSIDTALFTIPYLYESYISGVSAKLVDAGKFISYKDSIFKGSLKFWLNNIPIKYNALLPSSYLITNIYGNNNLCSNKSIVAVRPDTTGSFQFSILNGQNINIEKDIPGTTSVQPVINGFDALLTRKILINDPSFTPTIYQMIAMDVNRDGFVSAGDVSQINQRAVLMIPEFKQAWNYDSSGNSNGQLSQDWLFIDSTRISTNPAYKKSLTFPADDGVGFSKGRVPIVPFCLPITIANQSSCPLISSETFRGILLGDVDGNYSIVSPNNMFRQNTSDNIILDLSKAIFVDGFIDIPVFAKSNDPVYAIDFSMKYKDDRLTFNSVINHTSNLQITANLNANDKTLRFTSNSLVACDLDNQLISIRFINKSKQLSDVDFNSAEGFLNGNRTDFEIINPLVNSIAATIENTVHIYPNPVDEILNVIVSENSNLELKDIEGKLILTRSGIKSNQKIEIDTQNLPNGIYLLKVYSDKNSTMNKIIISR